ncbi:prepilin peptidase [Haemophilus influenzae]|uniref:prepilin peptidase n=1 Tax=Haemophilus influenzae TaxID=727 RepID=UPI000681CB46|nr:A24 family peptidase [Haemophilus influenzae]KMZ14522.1 peptidase A24 [Haemophilus influenzae]KMZ14578.1 peptidase A24 [Haemophilus influenzae]CWW71155.1 type 4 prepilin-like protein specific leader peptidase [Haemophilus influenzae]CWX20570.1 type 4 prepilin-like protein specific leader peptidase [Haemophilus influenzae]
MIYFTMFLLGGILGIALWFYLSGFITCLQQEIYTTYIELFPQNCSPFQPHFASIQQKKCGHILRYFFSIGVGFIFLQIAFKDSIFAVWLGLTLLILWAVSYLDWHYQLISTTPCLWLLTLGLFGADNNLSLLTLSESIKSAASFFIVFYTIYWLAKFYYGKEAFGRGDYWLAMALGSFIHLETLPHFLLLASVLGICFSLIHKKKKEFIPFAPFMNLSAIIIYFVKYYGY